MRRLAASDLLPERAGQPVRVVAHIALADLLLMEGSSALQEEWIASARAAWVAARAGASVGGSDGAAWLDSDAAQAVACDASVTPVVTGDVNPAALDDLVRLCVELDRLRHRHGPAQAEPEADTARAWEALEQAVIGQAVDLVSGPGGLASFLRRRQLGAGPDRVTPGCGPRSHGRSAFGLQARILGLIVIVRPFGRTVLRVSLEPMAICPEASGNSGFQRGYAARSVSAAQTLFWRASIWIVADTVFIASRPRAGCSSRPAGRPAR